MKNLFEKLEVWYLWREPVKDNYRDTTTFHLDEKFGLTSQLRRTSKYVNGNITEGSARWSKKDQPRYSEIAFGILIEILDQLIHSVDLRFLQETQLTWLSIENNQDGSKLNSINNHAINTSSYQPTNKS